MTYNMIFISAILVMLITPTIMGLLIRNKSDKFKRNFIIILALLNFLLHFIKMFFSPYKDNLPASYHKLSFENICAFTTILIPFVLMFVKNKTIRSYFITIAIAGGIAGTLYGTAHYEPVEINNFELYRYVTCHTLLFSIGILSVVFNLDVPRYKDVIFIPFMWMAEYGILFLNDYIFYKSGIVGWTEKQFYSSYFNNQSMVYGPMKIIQPILDKLSFLVPDIFQTNSLNIEVDGRFYFPVLWMSVIAFTIIPLAYLILTSIFKLISKKKKKNKA